MCLGIPAKVCEIDGLKAVVDFGGIKREVLVGISRINQNDLVMVHAGMIIGKLDEQAVVKNLAAYRDIMTADLIAQGMNSKDAEIKAQAEFVEILNKLGIKWRGIEMTQSSEEKISEKRTEIPEIAFKQTYRASLSDTDYLQVMHYTNYLRYCERTQQELLRSIGFGYATLIHKYGLFIPTVETSLKLTGPIRLDNEFEVYVWVKEIGKKHIKFQNVIKNLTSGKIVAEGTTTAVCTDISLMEGMELPEELVQKLSKYLVKEVNG
mgnify:CR=1 FL=1